MVCDVCCGLILVMLLVCYCVFVLVGGCRCN